MRSLFFLTLFVLISCNKNQCENKLISQNEQASSCNTPTIVNENPEENSPLPLEEEFPSSTIAGGPDESVPEEASLFEADITFYNFKESEKIKVNQALSYIKQIIRSKEFREKVLNYTYNGKKEFIDNGGKSNEEVYQSLLDGSEMLIPGRDHTMNLELELYYNRWTSTVGYTTPDSVRVWMNRKFFSGYTAAEVAGNLFHEWTHKLGFDHDRSYSASRDHSVPYALGYLMEELAKKLP
jgi:hypothetical protein